jgi:hypothetical protein
VIITQTASVTFTVGPAVKLQVLLPGETAAPGTALGYTGAPVAESIGVAFGVTVNAVDAYWNIVPTVTGVPSGLVSIDSLTDVLFTSSSATTFTSGVASFAGTFNTAGTETVTATDNLLTLTGTSAGAPVSAALSTLLVTAPSSVAAGSAFSVTVAAYGANSLLLTGYQGTVHFTSTDTLATLPANYTFTLADAGDHVFSVILQTPGSQTVTATALSSSIYDVSSPILVTTAGTYHAVTPARLVDTRINLGITGALSANSPDTFQVWGLGGVPSNATAVTGNLTVTDSTAGWAVFLGPNATASPTSSTINFTAGQIVANGVTVALSATGSLSATYISTAGNTTDLVFDVTGYFTPDTTGAYYFPITPGRVLDTRYGIGLSAKLSANIPVTFQVTGTAYVPSNASAVTGNLTVTDSTSGWAVFLGPNATASPTSSTINFKAGGIVANGVTVALSSLGQLSATYMSTAGQTTDLVFDVTGYFVQGGTTGARYVPVTPARILDTRYGTGLYGALSANVPDTFTVWAAGGVPSNALGVTGNLTVTDQTSGWAVFLGPNATYTPSTSTINFNYGQVLANGVTVGLSGTGTLSATYISTTGQTTDLVFDVTGYFVH